VENGKILISGAGIAGPALAYWLRRHGFTITVVERAPSLRPGGHAVDLRGVAREVTERMGIMDEVRRSCVDERGVHFVNERGRPVASMPAHAHDGGAIVAEIEIMRGDLARILFEATRDSSEYLFDDWITDLAQDDAGVKVTFARGAPRVFDLVVGADGTHSAVRALAFGEEQQAVRHLGAYTAYFTTPRPDGLDGWFLMHNAPGGRVAAIRPDREPAAAKAMFSFASPPLHYDRRDVGHQKQILAERFAGMGWLVPHLLATMWDAPDLYFDAICQVHLERWSRGRTVLLGDAAFCGSPLSGLGSSLAIVGAYVLAGELAAAKGDHRTAFARYEGELRGYVEQCQKLPPGGVQGFLPRTRLALWLRNQSMRASATRPMRALIARQVSKADAITLKDYPAEPPLGP
jgi:2-polyprenyl-6-methoxyphenol hydroxylase-like FAD-dependent oxidoreductase